MEPLTDTMGTGPKLALGMSTRKSPWLLKSDPGGGSLVGATNSEGEASRRVGATIIAVAWRAPSTLMWPAPKSLSEALELVPSPCGVPRPPRRLDAEFIRSAREMVTASKRVER